MSFSTKYVGFKELILVVNIFYFWLIHVCHDGNANLNTHTHMHAHARPNACYMHNQNCSDWCCCRRISGTRNILTPLFFKLETDWMPVYPTGTREVPTPQSTSPALKGAPRSTRSHDGLSRASTATTTSTTPGRAHIWRRTGSNVQHLHWLALPSLPPPTPLCACAVVRSREDSASGLQRVTPVPSPSFLASAELCVSVPSIYVCPLLEDYGCSCSLMFSST